MLLRSKKESGTNAPDVVNQPDVGGKAGGRVGHDPVNLLSNNVSSGVRSSSDNQNSKMSAKHDESTVSEKGHADSAEAYDIHSILDAEL